MNIVSDKLKFYCILGVELLLLPILMLYHEMMKVISSGEKLTEKKLRKEIENDTLFINIHEWGGYDLERKKKINKIPVFRCGLKYQIERYAINKCKYTQHINLTLSDPEKFRHFEEIKNKFHNIDFVSNHGMDFSGYSYFYDKIKDLPNAFVILTNTSVNRKQTLFLDEYIHYMESNKDVGIMGISYSSKIMQTLVRNNFTPHLQSFFLLTTSAVLKEIVEANNNKFPGAGCNHKLMLIRNGEIRMSQLAINLGYNLAVTLENGSIFKFGTNSIYDNGYKRWTLKKGDVRLFTKAPNVINEIY